MSYSPLFLTVLVLGAVLLAAAGCVLLAVLFVVDRRQGKLW